MVAVFSKDKTPLMPCTQKRARKLMEKGKAKPYWFKGFFCIIMQEETQTYMQEIAVGIDPGSKMNGLTVKSTAHTILNIQYAAKTKVKSKMESRKHLRRNRRKRNTPYRKHKFNRSYDKWLPSSTKARWQQHINMIKFCNKMYPITHIAFEDIKAETIKSAKKWNKNFSPIQHGKNWCYKEIRKDFKLTLYGGYDTYLKRNELGLHKGKDKMRIHFDSHTIDSWVMANDLIGGHNEVDNKHLIFLNPLNFYRRQLHYICPEKGGIRKPYGGTLSMGIKRGTLVFHPKHKKCLVGGTSRSRISLHDLKSNKRLTQKAKKEDLKILTNMLWNIS